MGVLKVRKQSKLVDQPFHTGLITMSASDNILFSPWAIDELLQRGLGSPVLSQQPKTAYTLNQLYHLEKFFFQRVIFQYQEQGNPLYKKANFRDNEVLKIGFPQSFKFHSIFCSSIARSLPQYLLKKKKKKSKKRKSTLPGSCLPLFPLV